MREGREVRGRRVGGTGIGRSQKEMCVTVCVHVKDREMDGC